jgi:hypothetical protein
VFYHYFANYHYFAHPQTLLFTFSPRRRQRRRQQYEVFQKIFYETSLSNAKMTLSITSVRNNRMFQPIDTVLLILHSLFAPFSPLFDLNDDISLIYEIRTFQKLEKESEKKTKQPKN